MAPASVATREPVQVQDVFFSLLPAFVFAKALTPLVVDPHDGPHRNRTLNQSHETSEGHGEDSPLNF